MKKASLVFVVCMLHISLAGWAYAESTGNRTIRIVMVVASKDFTDQEYFDTRAVFDKELARVTVCSPDGTPAVSHDGKNLKVDAALASVKVDQFDAIVIVGGMGVLSSLLNSNELRSLVLRAYNDRKVVAAICIAPMVLARAGMLKNRNATCYSDSSVIAELKRNGARYADKRVVVDERTVTANGPDASAEFARAVLALLR